MALSNELSRSSGAQRKTHVKKVLNLRNIHKYLLNGDYFFSFFGTFYFSDDKICFNIQNDCS